MRVLAGPATDIADEVERIAREIAGPAADDVDRSARFPREAIDALKEARLLGALVPRELGGLGCELPAVAEMCQTLGRHCSSAAMVAAMHHIQIACLAGHRDAAVDRYLAEVAARQLLLASATSELGIGGDLRQSRCAVVRGEGSFSLVKEASTISYGEHADDLLVTARRAEDAAPSDQVLVLVRRADRTLERRGEWDTLGMRGTCSPGFLLRASGPDEQILQAEFAEIAGRTMLPVSHLLWASVWLGIAEAAATRAQSFVKEQARRTPGEVPPTATRLAELWTLLGQMRDTVRARCQPSAASVGSVLEMNALKVSASEKVVDIVHAALSICGIAGYRNGGKFSLGRLLRDAHSAALMIGNDRILANNAALLLVHKS
jgi:acyl-CoA dehydrogenase